MPNIGFTPESAHAALNPMTPNMLPWSVRATAGIPISFRRLTSGLNRHAPSSRLNSLWR